MRLRVSALALCLAVPLLSTCKSNSPSFLLSAVENTAPTIKGNVTTASLFRPKRFLNALYPAAYAQPTMPKDCTATYGYMCLGWEFFTLLREYDPTTNDSAAAEDRINTENMFYELDLAGRLYEQLSPQADALSAPKAIASPFDFGASGLTGETYDHAKNGITQVNGFGYSKGEANVAWRDDGTIRHFLLSVGSDEATGWTKGRHKLVMQGSIDQSTGDVAMNFVQFMQYPDDGGSMANQIVVLRTSLKGNSTTHAFQVQAAETNTGSGPGCWNWGSMQAAGFSKGAGKSFLVFYRGTNATRDPNGVTGPGTTGNYFCIGADTTKATFGQGIYSKPAGYAEADIPSACAASKADVQALGRWEINAPLNPQSCATPLEPTTTDYPVKGDSALFTGTGALGLGLSF